MSVNERPELDGLDINYATPKEEEVYVDPLKDEIKGYTDLSPWDKIKTAAQKYNLIIKDPKKNCKKCFERGYTGFESNMDKDDVVKIPVPCSCIFTQKNTTDNQQIAIYNRKMRRLYSKQLKQTKEIPNE